MSTFTLPRFAKTNGKTQKFSESQGVESPSSRSPSFFRTIKDKLGRSNGVFGSSQVFEGEKDLPETPEHKTYFSKTAGNGTMSRSINAFAWVSTEPQVLILSARARYVPSCDIHSLYQPLSLAHGMVYEKAYTTLNPTKSEGPVGLISY